MRGRSQGNAKEHGVFPPSQECNAILESTHPSGTGPGPFAEKAGLASFRAPEDDI